MLKGSTTAHHTTTEPVLEKKQFFPHNECNLKYFNGIQIWKGVDQPEGWWQRQRLKRLSARSPGASCVGRIAASAGVSTIVAVATMAAISRRHLAAADGFRLSGFARESGPTPTGNFRRRGKTRQRSKGFHEIDEKLATNKTLSARHFFKFDYAHM